MNLFRSEEHVRAWDRFDPASADGILPVARWAEVFNLSLFARRLDTDYLSHLPEYAGELFGVVSQLGEGEYWAPPPAPGG